MFTPKQRDFFHNDIAILVVSLNCSSKLFLQTLSSEDAMLLCRVASVCCEYNLSKNMLVLKRTKKAQVKQGQITIEKNSLIRLH